MNRHTVAVSFVAVAGIAILSGTGIFSGCCFGAAAVAAFALCLEI